MKKGRYVVPILLVAGWSANVAAMETWLCPVPREAPRADRSFHEGLDSAFEATDQLLESKHKWHKGDAKVANSLIDAAVAKLDTAQAAFSEAAQTDEDLTEALSFRPGVDQSLVESAFENIDQPVPATSEDALDLIVQEVWAAQERLADRRFPEDPSNQELSSSDQQLVQDITDIVGREMMWSTGVAGLIADSHLQ